MEAQTNDIHAADKNYCKAEAVFELRMQNILAFPQVLVRKILISIKRDDRPTLLLSYSFIKVKLIWI